MFVGWVENPTDYLVFTIPDVGLGSETEDVGLGSETENVELRSETQPTRLND